MDAQSFLDNFANIADAPDGVQRLRGLVFDLAVSGRLVKQDPGEGSAAVLLLESAAERAELFRRGLVPKPRATAVTSENTPPFDLPNSWSWSHLDSVAVYIQRGKGPKYSPVPTSVPVVSQKCVQWSGFDLGPARHVLEESLTEYGPERFLQPGDLLWNSTGTGTVGRVAIVQDRLPTERIVADSHITVVRLARCRSRYVAAWLSSTFVQSRIDELTSGTTQQQELNTSTVRDLGLPLPPLLEQERIVAKVDELMGLCDELQARQQPRQRAVTRLRGSALHALTEAETPEDIFRAWARVSTNWPAVTVSLDSIPALHQTILQLAVGGKLTPQDRHEQPARDLLVGIAKQQARLKAHGTLPGVRLPILPPSLPTPPLPDGWTWIRLGAVLRHCRNGLAGKPNDDGLGLRLLRISAGTSNPDGQVALDDHKFVAIDDESAAPFVLEEGDLLACRFNGNLRYVGRVSIVPEHAGIFLHPDKLIRMKAISTDHRYLMIALNSRGTRAQVEGAASTTAGNIGINGAQLQALHIPLPPLSEQKRIADRVEHLFSLCADLSDALSISTIAAGRAAAGLVHSLRL